MPVLLSSAWFCAVLLGSARFCAVLRNVLRFCVGSARFCAVLLDVLPILSVLRCSAECSAVLRRFCDVLLNVLLNARFCADSAQFLLHSPRGMSTFRFCDPITVPFRGLFKLLMVASQVA